MAARGSRGSSGGGGGAASSGGGSSSSAASSGGGASSGASAAAPTPAQTRQETRAAAQQQKQEDRAAAQQTRQEVKTAQQATNQVAREIKKTGTIANLDAYNQALAVLKASKPTAATKVEANIQKLQTRAAARNITPVDLRSGTTSFSTTDTGTTATETPKFDLETDQLADFKDYFTNLLGTQNENFETQISDLGEDFQGKLSGYQDLLSQLKSTAVSPAPAPSAPASDQSDDFKAFDPNLFTDLLAQVQGGSSMEQRKQLQEFKQQDESRDYAQALKAYRF